MSYKRITTSLASGIRHPKSGCLKRMLGILRMLGESGAFAPRNESLAYGIWLAKYMIPFPGMGAGLKNVSGSKNTSLHIWLKIRELGKMHGNDTGQ